jgi:hypothetical protein
LCGLAHRAHGVHWDTLPLYGALHDAAKVHERTVERRRTKTLPGEVAREPLTDRARHLAQLKTSKVR